MAEMLSPEEALFHAALAIDAADQRAAYLDAACGNQDRLRRRVEALLRRFAEAEGPLDRPGFHLGATLDEPLGEGPGTQIGPYKLLEQIGEGGMGLVFMAEQSRPVRRRVALKVIKPGMDTRHVVARFEVERQALALMDHPNIAKIHDGGTTDSGRPYFVMELVRGVPITEFCDQRRLTTRQRLELFVTVCQAVQHAHQKGIIHREIDWRLPYVKNVLGGALLGQKKHVEAEPLLVQGYEGMKRAEAMMIANWRYRLPEAGDRVIRYYEETKQPEKAREWRERLKPASHPGP